MENRRSEAFTLLLMLYEAGLALCAMYHLGVCINNLIPESLIPDPISLILLFP